MNLLRLIIGTELIQFARQPIALWMLIAVPLLPPATLKFADAYDGFVSAAASDAEPKKGAPRTYNIRATPEAMALLDGADGLRFVDGLLPADGPIGKDDALADVRVDDHTVLIDHRDDIKRSVRATSRIESRIDDHNDAQLQAALTRAGHPEQIDGLLVIRKHDLGGRDDSSNALSLLVMSMIMMVINVFSIFTGLDLIAGEKERGTGETLLSSAADRRTILLAKAATVAAMSIGGGLASVAMLWLASMAGMELPRIAGGPFLLSGQAWFWLTLSTVIFGTQLAAISIALGSAMPDYRTGSMAASPIMVTLMSAPAVAAAPGISLNLLVAMVPLLGLTVALRDAMAGTLVPSMGALALLAGTGHAALLGWWAARRFDRPDALIPSSGSGARRAMGDYRAEAFASFIVALLGFWYVGTTSMVIHAPAGFFISQIGVFATVALLTVWWVGLPPGPTLSLRLPPPVSMLQGLAMGLTVWAIAQVAMALVEPVLPISTEWAEGLADMVQLDDYPLVVMLVCTSLLPGICEELLFRGAILGMLRKRLSDPWAVTLTAIAFGLMHLSLVRLVPTTLIGLCLGLLTVRSGSILPAMVAHTLNNAFLTLLSRSGHALPSEAQVGLTAMVGLLTLWWISRSPAAASEPPAHR